MCIPLQQSATSAHGYVSRHLPSLKQTVKRREAPVAKATAAIIAMKGSRGWRRLHLVARKHLLAATGAEMDIGATRRLPPHGKIQGAAADVVKSFAIIQQRDISMLQERVDTNAHGFAGQVENFCTAEGWLAKNR